MIKCNKKNKYNEEVDDELLEDAGPTNLFKLSLLFVIITQIAKLTEYINNLITYHIIK